MDMQSIDYELGVGNGADCTRLASMSAHRRPFEQLAAELGFGASAAGPLRDLVAAMETEAQQLPRNRPDADDALDAVFGTLEQRLGKLSLMQTAAACLFAVLTPDQRRSAERLLPLCCVPRSDPRPQASTTSGTERSGTAS